MLVFVDVCPENNNASNPFFINWKTLRFADEALEAKFQESIARDRLKGFVRRSAFATPSASLGSAWSLTSQLFFFASALHCTPLRMYRYGPGVLIPAELLRNCTTGSRSRS